MIMMLFCIHLQKVIRKSGTLSLMSLKDHGHQFKISWYRKEGLRKVTGFGEKGIGLTIHFVLCIQSNKLLHNL